jgi:dGTPase
MMDAVTLDLVAHVRSAIRDHAIASVDDVRRHGGRLAAFSPEMRARMDRLKAFLWENVYRHPRVVRMQTKAIRFVTGLFDLYRDDPRLLPLKDQRRLDADGLERVIADYISGMTDRYCLEEYNRAFAPTLRPEG